MSAPHKTIKTMATKQKNNGVVRCWCFSKHGEPHCPLTTNPNDLYGYFNKFFEDIVWVDIDKDFVCEAERTEHCKNCPFMYTDKLERLDGVIKAMTAYGGDCTEYESFWSDENLQLFNLWLTGEPKVKDVTLYRGYSFNETYYNDAAFEVGKVVGVDALTQASHPSFTSSMMRAVRYMDEFGDVGIDGQVRVLFVIHTHGASFVDISARSYYPEESEYKCQNDVRLKVTGVTRKSGFYQIDLEETDSCPCIIKVSGEIVEVKPMNGTDFQLEELQAIVGGYIEIVNLHDGRIFCINDSCKVNNLPYNYKATEIYRNAFHTSDYLCGDVLLCLDGQIR